jgi:uncharacterized membrane protein
MLSIDKGGLPSLFKGSDTVNTDLQNRLKSSIMWVGIIAYVIEILNLWHVDDPRIKGTLTAVLSILILLGVVNNPTDKYNL